MSSALLADRIVALEEARRSARIPQADLAREAGLSLRAYTRLLGAGDLRIVARQNKARPIRTENIRTRSQKKIDGLEKTLADLIAGRRRPAPDRAAILAAYNGFVAMLAPGYGVTVDEVAAADPQRGATADPTWCACRHVAQASLYLVNQVMGLKQRRLAEVLGLTPAAVCLALRAVEDRRDDPALDAALRRAGRLIAGREE